MDALVALKRANSIFRFFFKGYVWFAENMRENKKKKKKIEGNVIFGSRKILRKEKKMLRKMIFSYLVSTWKI